MVDVTREVPGDLATAIELGGEMGRRFASYDWDSHPLGPLSEWPAETRAIVAMALTSRFPIVLWLGEQLWLVYNDAYIAVLGEKHPAALGGAGREVWWDIWETIGPMLAGVADSGRATWSDDLMLPLVTAGRRQERYFTFTYSPIIAADGRVDGVFCAVTETTDRVLGARRLQTLNDLAAALIDTQRVDEVVQATIAVCDGPHPDLPFAAVYLGDPTWGEARLRAASMQLGSLPASIAGLGPVLPMGDGSPDTAGIVEDLPERHPKLRAALGESCPERAMLIGLADPAQPTSLGSLLIGLNPDRPLDEQYRGFCRLLGDQVAGALANAGAYELQRRRADTLAELDRAKTAFLTNVSHEFRTPLTLLLGPLEDAIAAAAGEPAQAQRLETAQRNARRLLRLVNSLLDFSRVEAGQSAPHLVRTDVGALTARIASSFSELCARAGIDLILTCQPAAGGVDVDMWETIMLNLLSNAVKFTFAGSITVDVAARESSEIDVRVRDTGVGIAADDLERLFERFYRASNARGRTVEGSGIGLSLVRSLVQLHGGRIEVLSEPDVGTTVSLHLPAAQVALPALPVGPAGSGGERDNAYVAEAWQWLGPQSLDAPVAQVTSAVAAAADGAAADGVVVDRAVVDGAVAEPKALVLIADDNADMRRYLNGILSQRWSTLVYRDGEAALAGARQHRPDLVVTDVMMPTLDGFGLVAAMRSDPALASVPVLMLSARAGVDAAGEGFAHGADDYLAKPFRSQDLLNRVAARLDSAARERATREHQGNHVERAGTIADVGAALSTLTSIGQVPTALLAFPGKSLGASAVAVGVLAADDQLRVGYAGALHAELRDRYHTVARTAPVPIAAAVRDGRAVILPDTLRAGERYRGAARDAEPSVRAMVVEPLRGVRDDVIGAVAWLWPQPRDFEPAELEILGEAAGLVGTAVERVRLAEREHQIASSLQDELLRLEPRSTAAVVGAVYQPAGAAMRVGGDWYATVEADRPDCLAVSVGDVVGHGLQAATVMSQLRSALGAAALTASDPTAVLDLLERFADNVSGTAFATVAYAVIDPAAQAVTYACAGHPYPLLVSAEGKTGYLTDARRPPLAAGAPPAETAAGRADLPAGSLLVLYTDGLIERPGESLDVGLARLAEAAAECARLPAGGVCGELLARLTPDDGYPDDVAILAVRPVGATPDTFVAAVPADTSQIRPLRDRLREWLADLDLDDAVAYDLLVSTGEAISNAIEHGGQSSRRTVSLEVFADPENLFVSVSDSGQWSSDSADSRRAHGRGRGLTLIHGLSDDVTTTRTIQGTRLSMRYRRHRTPRAGSDTGRY